MYCIYMQNSKYLPWISFGVLAGIVLVGYALWSKPSTKNPSVTFSTSTTSSTTSGVTKNGITASGDFTVSNDNTPTLVVPDFRTPLKISSEIAPDVRAALVANQKIVVARLAKDSFDFKSWLDLGLLRKMGGDYKGAETIWKFVTTASPQNTIAYYALGDLYMNFIKDYPKAESAYLTVIKLEPAKESAYSNLATMYAELYKKDTSAAEEILKKGIAAIPDSIDLHVQLARYYKSKGRIADAKIQFDAAISVATRLGQKDVADQLRTEKASL